ncbi:MULTISPECIES: hypothetical protein [Sphingobacterium]|uniref:hypothetical protein n=1 Tax=Sphingobacterium TaxID=28453 RepID=UPI000B48EE5C|nr:MULTISPECIES: hypothetical protein [Sphingobacterium]
MNRKNNLIKVAILVFFITCVSKQINGLEWWFYVIPLFFIGIFYRNLISGIWIFFIGFLTNFVQWILSNIFFYLIKSGALIDQYSFTHVLLGLFVSGAIGGLLSGLALYAGKNFLNNNIRS